MLLMHSFFRRSIKLKSLAACVNPTFFLEHHFFFRCTHHHANPCYPCMIIAVAMSRCLQPEYEGKTRDGFTNSRGAPTPADKRTKLSRCKALYAIVECPASITTAFEVCQSQFWGRDSISFFVCFEVSTQ